MRVVRVICLQIGLSLNPTPLLEAWGPCFWDCVYPHLLSKGFPRQRVLGGVLWGHPGSTHLCCWLLASPQRLQWLVRGP